jgi:hypothetical protein
MFLIFGVKAFFTLAQFIKGPGEVSSGLTVSVYMYIHTAVFGLSRPREHISSVAAG